MDWRPWLPWRPHRSRPTSELSQELNYTLWRNRFRDRDLYSVVIRRVRGQLPSFQKHRERPLGQCHIWATTWITRRIWGSCNATWVITLVTIQSDASGAQNTHFFSRHYKSALRPASCFSAGENDVRIVLDREAWNTIYDYDSFQLKGENRH